MEALFIIPLAIIFSTMRRTSKENSKMAEDTSGWEVLDRPTKLNPEFYTDYKAFRRLTHELGFD